jgi:hypothetical protein
MPDSSIPANSVAVDSLAADPDAADPGGANRPRPTPSGATPLDAAAPRQVGAYAIVAQLGIGGMGTVYLGEAADGTPVAIKLVHPHLAADREFRERFEREVRAGQRVPAHCTARYIDSGNHEGRPYLVSEYIDGVPVSDLVAVEGPMDEATLHSLAVGAAACLAGIHRAGLVHRDVKPSNVLVALAGVRVIDFGIARAMDATGPHTRTGMVMASLGWAAPEQLPGEPATPAMDVFSWGALVAYAATGRHPYGGADVAARVARMMYAEPDLTGVPASLRRAVASALRRDPAERPTADQLLARLANGGATSGSVRSGRRVLHPVDWHRHRRAIAFAAGLPAALLLVIGVANGINGGDGIGPSLDRPANGASSGTSPNGVMAVDNTAGTGRGGAGNGAGGRPGGQAGGNGADGVPADGGVVVAPGAVGVGAGGGGGTGTGAGDATAAGGTGGGQPTVTPAPQATPAATTPAVVDPPATTVKTNNGNGNPVGPGNGNGNGNGNGKKSKAP